MRKFIALALLVGAVLALPATMAEAGDVKGPACLDIVSGDGSTEGVIVRLAAEPCRFASYTLYVYADDTMTTLLRTVDTYQPLGGNAIGFNPGSDSDGAVCVAMTTSIGAHVFDSAPNSSGCADVQATSGGGFTDFN